MITNIMPLTFILRGCKNTALPQHGEEVPVAFHKHNELKNNITVL